jgi:hypothetical protein
LNGEKESIVIPHSRWADVRAEVIMYCEDKGFICEKRRRANLSTAWFVCSPEQDEDDESNSEKQKTFRPLF